MSEAALAITSAPESSLTSLFAATPQAAKRTLEFFATQIHNDHTRRAYLQAMKTFSAWCGQKGIDELRQVEPIHVAAYIKELGQHRAAPTVKQHLAALRMLFDWLVTGQVLALNPAHAVRGPKYVVKKGKTPVLNVDEARTLLDSIKVVIQTKDENRQVHESADLAGLRDRALIGVMVYTFARVSAVLEMKVSDYFVQGRRGWVRLHEKGGKEHDVPCHHNLEELLDAYIAAVGFAGDSAEPLFQTVPGKTRVLSGKAMAQQDAYRVIQRRAALAGIETKIGNHTFRATGITAYLKNDGKLEIAQQIANHESPRTTKLYDRRQDEISLDEIERIAI